MYKHSRTMSSQFCNRCNTSITHISICYMEWNFASTQKKRSKNFKESKTTKLDFCLIWVFNNNIINTFIISKYFFLFLLK